MPPNPPSNPTPKKADLVTPFVFRIEWKDRVVHDFKARELRLACPCASCVDEGTGRPLLDPKTVRDDILLFGAELVGRYGLTFIWSDGHKTGIFAWPKLYALGQPVAAT
jgi:ATP-binding protein involved in chromosome partitioning